jgi:thiol-disulfide isomerase/thioredoxin
MRRLGQLDAFTPRKVNEAGLPQGTALGASISIAAAIVATLLFVHELRGFLTPSINTSIRLDRGGPEDAYLGLELNVSVPWLSCELASLDLSDATGFSALNISRGITKTPIDSHTLHFTDSAVNHFHDGSSDSTSDSTHPTSSDEHYPDAHGPFELGSDFSDFFQSVKATDIALVMFYAPWCSYSQTLQPIWETAARRIHGKYDPNDDRRIMLASVDCSNSEHTQLCKDLHVMAFPSIRIFRGGSDTVQSHGRSNLHLAYVGQHTVDALLSFTDSIIPRESHQQDHPEKEHADKLHVSETSAQVGSNVGCNLHGLIHARKVPGSLAVTVRGQRSFAARAHLNLSHHVHWVKFGEQPKSESERRIVSRLHPEPEYALSPTLDDLQFSSLWSNVSFEHYLQPCRYKLQAHKKDSVNVYESTISSHSYIVPDNSVEIPESRFQFSPSPYEVRALCSSLLHSLLGSMLDFIWHRSYRLS